MEQNTEAGVPMTPVVNSKQKSGNGLKIATVVACIMAVCGIGFGAYGMMQSSQKDSQISDLKVQIKDSNDKITTLEANLDEGVNGGDTVITDGYQVFSNNMAKNYTATIFGYYYHYTGSDNVKRTVTARVDNSHLTIIDVDNGSAIIAEADDIISAYFIGLGNGGVPYFYLIKKDGGIARINISENGPRVIENIDGYEKIVSIFGCGDAGLCGANHASLVDINGNVYENS